MTIGRRTRDVLAVLAIALASAALFASPLLDRGRGLSLDVLTWLRFETSGPRHDPAQSPAVVVGIDEDSYQSPPLKGSPLPAWTGEIGRVLGAMLDGGAAVIGFDVVFQDLIEQSEIPFGDGTLGDKVRGFDRDFLRALATGSAAGKVVLGEVVGAQPIVPSRGQQIAVRGTANLRPLNIYMDRDDVARRIPLTFTGKDGAMPAMALELAGRALGTPPVIDADGTLTLAGHRVVGSVPNTMTLNFEGGADDIPTYSFADLRACAIKGDTDYFRREFAGKVVLIGTVTGLDDRRQTSKRFATRAEGTRRPRCALPERKITDSFARSTIPGVYIHATAVNNLIRNDAAIELGRAPALLLAVMIALAAATLAQLFKPLTSAAILLGIAVLYTAVATLLFSHALVLPLVEPLGAGVLALAAMIGYRFMVSDKDRRLLQKSFAYYLAPREIERMLAQRKLPQLGGETRDVTVFFSDIEGFSAIAERMTPHDLMALTNEYLTAISDVIEDHGGYVDKYIGNSVVAVFGAPLDDPDHATSAARRTRLPGAARGAEPQLDGVPRHQGRPAYRHQQRRRAGRQFRLAAPLQLFGHERCRERRLAARRRQQVLWHHHHRLRYHGGAGRRGLRLARARYDQGQGPRAGDQDLRAARTGDRHPCRTSGHPRLLCRGACRLARRRISARRGQLCQIGGGRPAERAVCRACPKGGD